MPLTVLCSMATRAILADAAALYQTRTGLSAAVQPMGGVEAAKRVRAGESFDVVALARNALEKLEAEGHLIAGSRVDFARSGIAIAVAAGAPVPDLHNGDAVRAAMLAAGGVGYSTGPSGDYLQALWQRWNISDVMATRAVQAMPGEPVAQLVAQGRATLGFQQLSELINQSGIVIAGMLPPDIQSNTIFSASVSTLSASPIEARHFCASLTAAAMADIVRRHGMEPVA